VRRGVVASFRIITLLLARIIHGAHRAKKKKKKKVLSSVVPCFAPVLFSSLSLSLSLARAVLWFAYLKIQNVKTLNLRVKPTLSNFLPRERERKRTRT